MDSLVGLLHEMLASGGDDYDRAPLIIALLDVIVFSICTDMQLTSRQAFNDKVALIFGYKLPKQMKARVHLSFDRSVRTFFRERCFASKNRRGARQREDDS